MNENHLQRTAALSFLTIVLGMSSLSPYAFGATMFGPKQYVQTGSSNTCADTFTATTGQGTLIVLNGQAGGQKRVSSATVKINGQTIFGETNFSQSIYQLEAPINLLSSNTVEVVLKNNKKGSYITVEVRQGSASGPTVNMSSSPSAIQTGASSVLSGTSTNATSAPIDQGIGSVPVNGSTIVAPAVTTTYTITVAGSAGTAQSSATVKVTGGADAFPDGSFAKKYEHQIPPDSTATYDPKRFSLITGKVQDLNGSPIAGVPVTIFPIHKHPEYGTAAPDGNGPQVPR
jgi:hypothetical protein